MSDIGWEDRNEFVSTKATIRGWTVFIAAVNDDEGDTVYDVACTTTSGAVLAGATKTGQRTFRATWTEANLADAKNTVEGFIATMAGAPT